jgi:hypothetical protein
VNKLLERVRCGLIGMRGRREEGSTNDERACRSKMTRSYVELTNFLMLGHDVQSHPELQVQENLI